jgi:hypothetical protein
MTCDELHDYIEDQNNAAAAAKHLESCAECRRLVDAAEELRRCLRSVRCTAPKVPAALDTAVLTAYRDYVQQPTVSSPAALFRSRMNAFPTRLAWVAAAAALFAVMLLIVDRRIMPRLELRAAQPNATIGTRTMRPDNTPSANARFGDVRSDNVVANSPTLRRKMAKPRPHFTGPKEPPAYVEASGSFSAGFQNLMYCDALSCSGAMEVIRMQLPAGAMSRDPAMMQQRDGIVLADVLVGSDGIARAIRIVN